MKPLLLIVFLSFLGSCNQQKLDYIKDFDQIKEVVLLRPDKNSNGKIVENKALSSDEIKELLIALSEAKPIGPNKFEPDYYVQFEKISLGNKRLKVNGTFIKGYENDFTYEIRKLDFLDNF